MKGPSFIYIILEKILQHNYININIIALIIKWLLCWMIHSK